MSSMSTCSPTALAFGNDDPNVFTTGVRVIVPQLAFMKIADVILAEKVQHFSTLQVGPSKYFFEAARPKT